MAVYNTEIAPSLALAPPPPISQAPEKTENVQPLRYTLKRVTGKGHKKNRKRKRRSTLWQLLICAPATFNCSTYSRLAYASTLHVAENNGAAPTPFMGWSTWNFDGYYPTESNVEAQANVEASNKKNPFDYDESQLNRPFTKLSEPALIFNPQTQRQSTLRFRRTLSQITMKG